MRCAAALALAVSASLSVVGPASAQRSTTGVAPPLVSPAPPLVSAPLAPPAEAAPAPMLAPAPAPPIAVAPTGTPTPSIAPPLAPTPVPPASALPLDPAPKPAAALPMPTEQAPPAPVTAPTAAPSLAPLAPPVDAAVAAPAEPPVTPATVAVQPSVQESVPPSAQAPAQAPIPAQVSAPARASEAAATPSPSHGAAPEPQPQQAAPTPAAAPQPRTPMPKQAAIKCDNPTALGVARTVEIDTSGGPGFGFEHFRQHDFLDDKEVVLTFDDGPWVTTPAVLRALAAECVRATFFPIGKHATFYPKILRQVAAAGHTVGSHTWSHANLANVATPQEAIDEIEKGISAVQWALEDHKAAPFFRFPALRHPPDLVAYLGTRNIGVFSTDLDSFDFRMRRPEQVINSIMAKLKKNGKGVVLMHDFQNATARAVPELLRQLKAGGYKIVHMRPRDAVQTVQKYDDEFKKEDTAAPTASNKPTSSVVRTVE
jgi:peptidoglycan/xylan/chitin deacetylase (PgdA/CDA1 family)